jgi:predicted membrane protein
MTKTTPSAEGNRGEDSVDVAAEQGGGAIHLPSLLVAVAIMLGGSVYPLLFVGRDGEADHGLAMALFWAMSAGFIRGVGFLPRALVWRLLFSGWSCLAGLLLAAWLRWGT